MYVQKKESTEVASCARSLGWDSSYLASSAEFQLVNGSSYCEGRAEPQVQGTWAPLCAASSDSSRCNGSLSPIELWQCSIYTSWKTFWGWGRPIWPDVFHCVGTEPHLLHCPASTLGVHPCVLGDSASSICSGESSWIVERKVCRSGGPWVRVEGLSSVVIFFPLTFPSSSSRYSAAKRWTELLRWPFGDFLGWFMGPRIG